MLPLLIHFQVTNRQDTPVFTQYMGKTENIFATIKSECTSFFFVIPATGCEGP
jgi:hypothetical protein